MKIERFEELEVWKETLDFQRLYAQTEKVARLTSGLITYLLRRIREAKSIESVKSIEPIESVEAKAQRTQ
jgi:hypothetical protein